jgi:hypothetical protein
MNNNSPNLNSFCRSIGLIYDRTAPGAPAVGSTFLIAEKKVASLASIVLPFRTLPESLRVIFPSTEREFGVSAIHLHPEFDSTLTQRTALNGTLGNGPEAALQKFNCSILELADKLPAVTTAQIEQVSQALRYPLSLTDEGFRGSLTEIELPLVIQTLNNAKREGILYICDDMYRPIAQIFCQGGRVLAAKYRSLMNELAIYQIVEKRLTGRFAFRACKPPMWMPSQSIGRSTDMLLIEAMRRQDEIAAMQKNLATKDYFFVRAYKQLYMENVAPDYRQAVEMIWRVLDGTTPAEDLWTLVPLDDYTILAALTEMYKSNQCMRVPLAGTMQFNIPKMPDESYAPAFLQTRPLPLGTQLPLNAFDTISSIAIDPSTSKPRVKVGALLGAIDPYDGTHLLHDIPLLPWASGSPLVKNDLVIGMHCGIVPNCSTDNSTGVLQQMLWCDSIEQVLKSIPGTVIPPSIPVRADSEEEFQAAKKAAQPVPQHAAKQEAQLPVSLIQQSSTIPEDIGVNNLLAKGARMEVPAEPSLKDTILEANILAASQLQQQKEFDKAATKDPTKDLASKLSSGTAKDVNTSTNTATNASREPEKDSKKEPEKDSKKEVDAKPDMTMKDTILEGSALSAQIANALASAVPAHPAGSTSKDTSASAEKAFDKHPDKKIDLKAGLGSDSDPLKVQTPDPPTVELILPSGPPGCREIASLRCAVCGERTFGSARRCGRCLNVFVPHLKPETPVRRVDVALPAAAILALLVIASAALAISRLPSPVYKDIALMSIPSKPPIKLCIIQAISSGWVERQPGTKFTPADAIAAELSSNKPCYVYLFMKQSGSEKAILLCPSQSERNNLSEGDKITYPSQLKVMTAQGEAVNSVSVSGKPGSDEFLAIATPREIANLNDVNNQDPVFEKAQSILAMSKSSGVLVPASLISGADGNDNKSSSKDSQEMVYITSVAARH